MGVVGAAFSSSCCCLLERVAVDETLGGVMPFTPIDKVVRCTQQVSILVMLFILNRKLPKGARFLGSPCIC